MHTLFTTICLECYICVHRNKLKKPQEIHLFQMTSKTLAGWCLPRSPCFFIWWVWELGCSWTMEQHLPSAAKIRIAIWPACDCNNICATNGSEQAQFIHWNVTQWYNWYVKFEQLCLRVRINRYRALYTFIHESTCTQKHKAAAFHQHESAFMFTAEQTEEGFTSCVYL